MKRVVTLAALTLISTATFAAAQAKDANQILAAAQKALGGDTLAAVVTLSAEGRSLRTGPDGNTRETAFEMALARPDKYRLRSLMVSMGNMSIYRHSGFNGEQVIEEMDRPPNLSGGNVVIRIQGPEGTPTDPAKMTPEQRAEANRVRLQENKRDFARLALGLFASSPEAYPMTFTYAGEAESPDGKADVLDVAGGGGFAARLFIDQKSHLPLMLTWMDLEPITMQMPGATSGPGGGMMVRTMEAGSQPPSREQLEKQLAEMAAKRKELEAKRRTVEFRVYYTDYQSVSGVMLPHRVQQAIAGTTTEEMVFDTFKVNAKIDAKTFDPSK